MSEVQIPGPQMPTFLVTHSAMEFFADGDDVNIHPDLYAIPGLKVKFTARISRNGVVETLRAAVWTDDSGEVHTLIPGTPRGIYNEFGKLRLLGKDGTPSSTQGVRLAMTSATAMVPSGWFWFAEWDNAALPSGVVEAPANGDPFDLSSVVLGSVVPGDATFYEDLLTAATDLQAAIDAGEIVTGGFSGAYGDLTGTPTAFAPVAHKTSHAIGGTDPLTPADIGAPTTAALTAGLATKTTEVRWTGTAWPARTADPYVTWSSTNDENAPEPTADMGLVKGDTHRKLVLP